MKFFPAKVISFVLLSLSLYADPVEEFYDELYHGNRGEVMRRIENGFGINTKNPEGDTPLTSAIRNEFYSLARELIEAGADIQISDVSGKTALMYSAELGHRGITLLLLEKGARLEAVSLSDETALTLAIDSCQFELADLLIEKGADFDIGKIKNKYLESIYLDKYQLGQSLKIIDWGDDSYPLLLAADADDWSRISKLLEDGLFPDESDSEGVTALMVASFREESFIPDLLVSAGADVNSLNRYGYSPLVYAANSGNTRVLSLLLENGARLSPWNILEKSPLYWAVLGKSREEIDFLINAGASLDIQGRNGQTILMTAALLADSYAVRLILENLDDPFQYDNEGMSALDYCLSAFRTAVPKDDYYETVRLLAGAGFTVNKIKTIDQDMREILAY